MTRRMKLYSDWIIVEDEFHPDPKIAAAHADLNAAKAAFAYHRDSVRQLEAIKPRTKDQEAYLAMHREALADAQQRITDFDKEDEE